MIKVVHIIQMLSQGGAARALLATAKYSARLADVRHHLISLLPADRIGLALASECGVSVTNAPDRTALFHELEQADVTQIHFWNNPEVYELLRSDLPVLRLLLWYHVAGDKPPQVLTKELIDFADFALACSPYTHEHPAFQALPPRLRAQKTGMVYGAADFGRLSNLHPKPHSTFNIGYIGTVDFVKMHPRYVPMSAAINVPQVRFVVCGGGIENILRQQAQQLGVADRFDFRGYVNDVRAVLESLDVYGYPLCQDTYAAAELNLQEAMYAGIPPVVFPYGGVKRLVEHNQTGLIVHSEYEYKEAVEHLYHQPKERRRLGQNARACATRIFGAENAARMLNPIYRRIMEWPKRQRVWGKRAGVPLLEQSLTIQDLFEVPANHAGARFFVESLGEAGSDFKRSMHSDKITEIFEAESVIAKASPLLRSGGAGGILNYRQYYLSDPHLRLWTGLVLLEHGDHVHAASEFSAAKSLGIGHWRVDWYLAECAKRRGDLAEAEVLLQKVRQSAPDFVEPHTN